MTIFENGDVHIIYHVAGAGFPVLLMAPGGMKSVGAWWDKMPWNPRRNRGLPAPQPSAPRRSLR